MPSTVKGRYFYWYMVKDIHSRQLVANEVHDAESAIMPVTCSGKPVCESAPSAGRWCCTRTMARP